MNPYGVIVMPNVQHYPAVWGRYVAYVDDGAGQPHVHVYDLWADTVRWASTSSTRGVEEPSISGSRVVWTDYRRGVARIWMYDLATRTEREVVPGGGREQHHPDIDGEWVVWTEPDSAGNGIHLHNVALGQDTVLRNSGMNVDHAAIGGGRVVFISAPQEKPETWEIYSYNMAGKFLVRITNTDNAEDYPDVSGDLIVWEDHRNGSDIYAYDLAAGQQHQFPIATTAADESRPRVSGKQVVWATGSGVFMYDHATRTTRQLASTGVGEAARVPALNQGCVVWEHQVSGDLAWSRECRETVLDARAFDPAFYLNHYADLRAAYGTDTAAARRHWLAYGIREGRRGSREFDVRFYLAHYSDLQAQFGTNYAAALNDWLTNGLHARRRGSPDFDAAFYQVANPDLTCIQDADSGGPALDHWIRTGLPAEGRRGTREFDVRDYLGRYPELGARFGTDYVGATRHWMYEGLPVDGRRGSQEVDVRKYLGSYSDLRSAYGSDYQRAIGHWIRWGLTEGRQASQEFWVKYYLQAYPDVQAAYGPSNYLGAFDHWIRYGIADHRRGAP